MIRPLPLQSRCRLEANPERWGRPQLQRHWGAGRAEDRVLDQPGSCIPPGPEPVRHHRIDEPVQPFNDVVGPAHVALSFRSVARLTTWAPWLCVPASRRVCRFAALRASVGKEPFCRRNRRGWEMLTRYSPPVLLPPGSGDARAAAGGYAAFSGSDTPRAERIGPELSAARPAAASPEAKASTMALSALASLAFTSGAIPR